MQLCQRLTIMRIAGSSQLTFYSWLRAGEIVPHGVETRIGGEGYGPPALVQLATGYIMFGMLLLLISRYPCPCSRAMETQRHCTLNLCRRNFFCFG